MQDIQESDLFIKKQLKQSGISNEPLYPKSKEMRAIHHFMKTHSDRPYSPNLVSKMMHKDLGHTQKRLLRLVFDGWVTKQRGCPTCHREDATLYQWKKKKRGVK